MEPNVTAVTSFDKVENEPLYKSLIAKFESSYKTSPAFVVRVPGRVNLIGEHIDYCGYSVLPMALDQHILIAAKPTNDTTLSLVNVNEKYLPYDCKTENLSFDLGNKIHWYNYVLCGVRGIAEYCQEKKICGMLLAVVGNVLPNSGLSSSSALVCAAALATAHANQIILTKHQLASLCAKSERYIGTEGGGMDQAIAFLANRGCAKHISFKPLRAVDVRIPFGLEIIVAHSCAELNKAASDHFNHRVAECRLASVVLAQRSGLSNWKKLKVLADVQSAMKANLSEMVAHTSKILCKDIYSKAEVCEILGMSLDELNLSFLPENIWETESFKLRQRATHVFEEALRVVQFQELCEKEGCGKELGHLMNLSHDSLQTLYECSHPQLDSLVSIARESGALGARLTGAGWGGCMVALVNTEHAATLISSLKEKFYESLHFENSNDMDLIFSSCPGSGAAIFQ